MFGAPGRGLLLAALVILALSAGATPAAPAGQIVVFGAASGSHLTLATRGPRIVVDGRMAARAPLGCRLARSHNHAVCPAANAMGIEVDMGPSGDFVEVLDRMPFPLTVHLGPGRDKFIGNGERDTCYGGGTRRNRCVGGPGNDVCVASTGSDGCWGGPGRDVCYMGPGQDGCHGEGGNDRLFGGPNPDQLYGGPGRDRCDGLPGIGRSHQCEAGPGS